MLRIWQAFKSLKYKFSKENIIDFNCFVNEYVKIFFEDSANRN